MSEGIDLNSLCISIWLFSALLGVGLKLTWSDFREFKYYKKDLAKLLILNYILLPTILLLLAISLNWKTDHSIFAIFLCLIIPGSPIALTLASSVKGDITFNVLSTLTLICCIAILTPIWLTVGDKIFHLTIELPYATLVNIILFKVLLPLIIGISIHSYKNSYTYKVSIIFNWIGKITLILLIVNSIVNQTTNIKFLHLNFYIAAVLTLLALMLLIYGLHFKNQQSRVVFLNSLVKNTALCLMLSKILGNDYYQATLQYSLFVILIAYIANTLFQRTSKLI